MDIAQNNNYENKSNSLVGYWILYLGLFLTFLGLEVECVSVLTVAPLFLV